VHRVRFFQEFNLFIHPLSGTLYIHQSGPYPACHGFRTLFRFYDLAVHPGTAILILQRIPTAERTYIVTAIRSFLLHRRHCSTSPLQTRPFASLLQGTVPGTSTKGLTSPASSHRIPHIWKGELTRNDGVALAVAAAGY